MDKVSQQPLPLLQPPHGTPLWELGIREVYSHNLESSGREEINRMLKKGWILLHVYTLRYHDDTDGGTWRERPMAILGRPSGVT